MYFKHTVRPVDASWDILRFGDPPEFTAELWKTSKTEMEVVTGGSHKKPAITRYYTYHLYVLECPRKLVTGLEMSYNLLINGTYRGYHLLTNVY